jgi:hypothetical protein
MACQSVSPTRIVDKWTCETDNGTQVTYRIIASSIPGFVYSVGDGGKDP